MWEERADQTDMEGSPDTTGEYCNCDAVEILRWKATVSGIETHQIQVQECEMFRRRHKYESHPCRHTTTSHNAKRERRNPAESCDTRVRCRDVCTRALREHPTHTSVEISDQQNDVEVSYTST